jgi:hypothetical protein
VRVSTAVIIGGALVAAGLGVYKLGHAADTPANEILTVAAVPQQAAVATAEANLAGAVSAAASYKLDHGDYTGMSAGDLRRAYDAGLAGDVTVRSATATAYCIESTIGSTTVSIRGPSGTFVVGFCTSQS